MRLNGKRAVVTGGSRGIGQAIAKAMIAEGAEVIVCSRRLEGITAAAREIGARPEVCHTGDLAAIEAFWERVGSVDILVNNAATNPYFGPMMDLEWRAWDKTFEVNVKGPFEMTRQAVKRGCTNVIFVSSVFGLTGAPDQGIYAMTKASLVSLTKTLSFELAPQVRVNAIAPGLVRTKFAAALTEDEENCRGFTDRSALGRVAEADEIGGVAVFLASEDARFITGQTLAVDGGYTVA